MKKVLYISMAVVTLFFMAACSSEEETPTPTPTEAVQTVNLVVSGSGSVTGVLAAIADEFEAANPGYVLEVLPGSGTGEGVTGTIDGTFDLAAMSRPARDTEAEAGIEYVQFGTSVTAIMTHPDVGVTELTGEQLKGIFTGTITNWSEVGGADLDIIVYVRDPEEGNTVDLRETFIGEDDFAASAQIMLSQNDLQNVVSSVEGAIGYGTWATALANEADVVSLSVDGMGVDNFPDTMITLMGIGYLTDRKGDVQPFIDWLASEEGQTTLTAIGVVPGTPE